MIHGIGIDIVEVKRLKLAIERQGDVFLRRVFTAKEQVYCESQANPMIHFAARFAAKEAVSKAFGTGIGGNASWLEIEVCKTAGGSPKTSLHGSALAFIKKNEIAEVQISLTHTEEYAAANAIAIKKMP